jgi:hypothetical protein
VGQGGTGVQVRGLTTPSYEEVSLESFLGSGGSAKTLFYVGGVSGFLPNPWGTWAAGGGNPPRISLRAAVL